MDGRKKIHRSRPLRRLRCALHSSGASTADWDATDGISLREPPRARITVTAVERRRAALNRARARALHVPPRPVPSSHSRDRCNARAIEWPCHVHARCNFFATHHPTPTPCPVAAAVYRTIAPTLPVANRQYPTPSTLRRSSTFSTTPVLLHSFFFFPIFYLSISRIRYVTSSWSRVTHRENKRKKSWPECDHRFQWGLSYKFVPTVIGTFFQKKKKNTLMPNFETKPIIRNIFHIK